MQAILHFGPFTRVMHVPEHPPHQLTVIHPQSPPSFNQTGKFGDIDQPTTVRITFTLYRVVGGKYAEYEYESEA